MFLYYETYYVTPGLQHVIDQRVRSLHENHATNPGFIAGDWLRAVGDPITYVAFRLWRQRDNEFDEAQHAFMAEYNRTRPADAFVHPPDIEFFEQIAQACPEPSRREGLDTGAAFAARSDMEVSGRPAWYAWEHEVRRALLTDEGFCEYRLYRFLGNENRFMRVEFWQSQTAAESFWNDPARRELMSQLPPRSFRRRPDIGYFEVLHQIGDARMG